VEGVAVPGFLVPGVIENGALGCPDAQGCPDDTAAMPQVQSGHTASDVPISASGPGALQFTGTFDNTDVFIKVLRAIGGSWDTMLRPRGR
jgi:alkaline phosphatase